MKKVLLLVAVIAAFSFVSCKKDRTCTCTTTVAGVAGTPDVTTWSKSRKSNAELMCMSYTETNAAGVVTTKDCKLK